MRLICIKCIKATILATILHIFENKKIELILTHHIMMISEFLIPHFNFQKVTHISLKTSISC